MNEGPEGSLVNSPCSFEPRLALEVFLEIGRELGITTGVGLRWVLYVDSFNQRSQSILLLIIRPYYLVTVFGGPAKPGDAQHPHPTIHPQQAPLPAIPGSSHNGGIWLVRRAGR